MRESEAGQRERGTLGATASHADSVTKPAILKIAVPVPKRCLYDYLFPQDHRVAESGLPPVGTRVQVEFRTRKLVGILVRYDEQSDIDPDKLKPVGAFLDERPALTPDVMELAMRSSRYYHHPAGEVLQTALPVLLRTLGSEKSIANAEKKMAVAAGKDRRTGVGVSQSIPLPGDYRQVANTVLRAREKWRPYLLCADTGDEREALYLHLANEIVKRGGQVLVLVPEAGMGAHIAETFCRHFGDLCALTHARPGNAARYRAWKSARDGRAQIIIGTPSAVFVSAPKLDLIIVDDEHDLSFKQTGKFSYSARDMSVLRAQIGKIPVLLVSRTPCLESVHHAAKGDYHRLNPSGACRSAPRASCHVIDTSRQKLEGGISPELVNAVSRHTGNGGRVLLLINRRGYASAWVCEHCGVAETCSGCTARLVFHFDPAHLRCHRCNRQYPVSNECTHCGHGEMRASGTGTQKCEQMLNTLLPGVPVYRVDSDSAGRASDYRNTLERIRASAPCMVVGTRLLHKEPRLPDMDLVAILDCDSALYASDFRAAEHFGQFVIQMTSHTGRQLPHKEIMIQTRRPDNPLLHKILRQEYDDFARTLLKERQQRRLPPYGHMALLNCEARNPVLAEARLNALQQALCQKLSGNTTLVGPLSLSDRQHSRWHRQAIIVYADLRSERARLLAHARQLMEQPEFSGDHRYRWSLDVDPQFV